MKDQKKAKLSEQTADRLYEMIIEQKLYPAGSKLPNENELSTSLQVSRTTLREAVTILTQQGILRILRGKGTFVSDILPESGISFDALLRERDRVRAIDLFEMRLIFEPATAALACARATDEELQLLEKKALRMEKIAAQGGDWPLADQEFHFAIIKASHNEYLRRLYPIINSAVNEILQITENRKQMEDMAIRDNRLLLDFLMRRDADGARHAMSIHLRHLMQVLHQP